MFGREAIIAVDVAVSVRYTASPLRSFLDKGANYYYKAIWFQCTTVFDVENDCQQPASFLHCQNNFTQP